MCLRESRVIAPRFLQSPLGWGCYFNIEGVQWFLRSMHKLFMGGNRARVESPVGVRGAPPAELQVRAKLAVPYNVSVLTGVCRWRGMCVF